MEERRSYWAWAASSAMHAALLALLVFGFAIAPKFEDSPEAIPVETVSQSELNQIMNGEKDAKPAPEPPPTPQAVAHAARSAAGPARFGRADARAPAEARAPVEARASAASAKTRAASAAEAHSRGRARASDAAKGRRDPARASEGAAGEAETGHGPAKAHAPLRSERDRQADRPEQAVGVSERGRRDSGDASGTAAS